MFVLFVQKQLNQSFWVWIKDGNKHYWYHGNNALPVADGKCCDNCNKSVVIPERMTNIMMSRVCRY